jgi:hypothetical protein
MSRTALATAGLALSLLPWVFAFLSFMFGFGDPFHEDAEELRRLIDRRAYLVAIFTSLAAISLLLATGIAGYTIRVARMRALLTAVSCIAFAGMVLRFYAR